MRYYLGGEGASKLQTSQLVIQSRLKFAGDTGLSIACKVQLHNGATISHQPPATISYNYRIESLQLPETLDNLFVNFIGLQDTALTASNALKRLSCSPQRHIATATSSTGSPRLGRMNTRHSPTRVPADNQPTSSAPGPHTTQSLRPHPPAAR